MYKNSINVTQLLEQARINSFHVKFLIWGALISAFEGYDLVVYGVVLPLLMQEWTLTAIQAGMLASTALVGMAVGSLGCGIIADYVGRKKIMMLSIILLSIATFLCAFASHPLEFGILRFLAGVGVGGIMPNIVALTAEFSPKNKRTTMIGLMSSGFAVGGIISAVIGSAYVQDSGWRIMFAVAGIPILLVPFMWKYMPESVSYLVGKGKLEQAQSILNRILPEKVNHLEQEFVLYKDSNIAKNSVNILFKDGRAGGTLLFWTAFFMILLIVYALSSWLPKLMMNAGYPLDKSIYFLIALNVGSILGTLFGGVLADKFNLRTVLVCMFLMGALALFGLGFKTNVVILYSLVVIAGASIQGGSILLYSYISQFYPLVANSTGIGWASSVGKFGAIVGPIVTGYVLTLHLTHLMNFALISIPAVIAVISIILIQRKKTDISAEYNVQTAK
ncbi:MFS transporter [Acinetobacter gerneri]|uniref:MFS transporter n=1 Tax=Acinetobacter gerneri TaxID=202952 RepID=UPI003A87E438